jgi:hypothetical protein
MDDGRTEKRSTCACVACVRCAVARVRPRSFALSPQGKRRWAADSPFCTAQPATATGNRNTAKIHRYRYSVLFVVGLVGCLYLVGPLHGRACAAVEAAAGARRLTPERQPRSHSRHIRNEQQRSLTNLL